MLVARASPRCMDWLHFLDTSGLGLLWRIIRGLWILNFLLFLDSADAPSCYQKGSVFDLAFSYSDAL